MACGLTATVSNVIGLIAAETKGPALQQRLD